GRRRHVAGALKVRTLLDPQERRLEIRGDPRARVQLDPFRGVHRALERAVDRNAVHVDLGVDLGGIDQDELASAGNPALEPSVDPKGFLEHELTLQVTALVEKPVERGAFTAWLHGTSWEWFRPVMAVVTFRSASRRDRPATLPIRMRSRCA